MQIRFLWVGKTKHAPIRSLAEDYLGRLSHLVPCAVLETRDVSKGRSLRKERAISAEGVEIAKHLPDGAKLVVLDERGREFSSVAFAGWFEAEMQKGTRSIAFVIGGAEGLSEAVTENAHLKLSLGKMTWTHEMCRVLLLEQVYRAFSIIRKIPYHK